MGCRGVAHPHAADILAHAVSALHLLLLLTVKLPLRVRLRVVEMPYLRRFAGGMLLTALRTLLCALRVAVKGPVHGISDYFSPVLQSPNRVPYALCLHSHESCILAPFYPAQRPCLWRFEKMQTRTPALRHALIFLCTA